MTTARPGTREVFDAAAGAPKMLYGIDETTRMTGLGRSKLYELIAAGLLESVKCGKRRLIPAAALESFIQGLRESSSTPAG